MHGSANSIFQFSWIMEWANITELNWLYSFSAGRKMLNWKWVSVNASFFHFLILRWIKKLEKSSLWLTRIFLSIFHFSVFPSNRKNAKMEYACGHFLFFDFSAFNRKRKNRKLTPGPLNFLFFYMWQKMEKSQFSLFFVTLSIF